MRLTAEDRCGLSPSASTGEEAGTGTEAEGALGLWRVETNSDDGFVAAPDLASLCAALHRRRHHGGDRVLRPGPETHKALRQGLRELVGGLKEELDLLCALVEGTAPDPALVRRVWLAEPARAACVYLLGLLVEEGQRGEEG